MVLERLRSRKEKPTMKFSLGDGMEIVEASDNWEPAYLGKDSRSTDEYLVSLVKDAAPTKKAYGVLRTSEFRINIEIPTRDHTSEKDLRDEAYLTGTFFGEVDGGKFREFATESFKCKKLLALLNRKAGDVSPDEATNMFYSSFGVEHLQSFGKMYIGSHGSSSNFYVTIEENRSGLGRIDESTAISKFMSDVRRSLPSIDFNPLPIDTYLADVQSTLQFLPKDWTA